MGDGYSNNSNLEITFKIWSKASKTLYENGVFYSNKEK